MGPERGHPVRVECSLHEGRIPLTCLLITGGVPNSQQVADSKEAVEILKAACFEVERHELSSEQLCCEMQTRIVHQEKCWEFRGKLPALFLGELHRVFGLT